MLHGGEPLAAGHAIIGALISGLKYIENREVDISIQSNLWLLDEQYCQLFKKYSVDLGTSLDGPKHLNDLQRGSGYFDKTMAGIILARSNGISVNCIATFTKELLPYWQEVFDFFVNNNLHFSIHPSVPSLETSNGMELSPDQYQNLIKNMFDYYFPRANSVKVTSIDYICQGIASGTGAVCTFCDCLGTFLAIDPMGDIYPCQRFAGKRQYSIGNICDNPTIEDLMNSKVAKMFLERQKTIAEKCVDCEYYGYCKGGCTYNAIAQSKELHAIDPYCKGYQSVFGYIGSRIKEDMLSDSNEEAIAQFGLRTGKNPLLSRGKVIDLTKEHTHPYVMSRTAKRLVAAYELAKWGDIEKAAESIFRIGISKTLQSSRNSLEAMVKYMYSDMGLGKLYLHITGKCQLKCSHCYISYNGNQISDMDTDDICSLILESVKCGVKEVVITGGEPLMHKDFAGLLEGILSIKQKIKPMLLILRTNFAVELQDEDICKIANSFNEVVVSVDGGEKEHDARRGKGAYRETVENIKKFKYIIEKCRIETPAKIILSASMTKENALGTAGDKVRQLGMDLNTHRVKFRPLLPLGRAANEPIRAQPLLSHVSEIELFEMGFVPKTTCGLGHNLYVEPSGEAYPCYAYHKPDTILGNVLKVGLKGVIENEEFIKLKKHNVDTNKACSNCNYRYICGGACRAYGGEKAQMDLDAEPLECDSLKQRAEILYMLALDYLNKYEY